MPLPTDRTLARQSKPRRPFDTKGPLSCAVRKRVKSRTTEVAYAKHLVEASCDPWHKLPRWRFLAFTKLMASFSPIRDWENTSKHPLKGSSPFLGTPKWHGAVDYTRRSFLSERFAMTRHSVTRLLLVENRESVDAAVGPNLCSTDRWG